MRHKKRCIGDAGIVFTLGIVRHFDRHIIGLAFNDNKRCFLIGLVFSCSPDNEVCPCLGAAPACDIDFLINLVQRIAVFVNQDGQVLLSYLFFRRQRQPFLTYRAENFVSFNPNLVRLFIFFPCHNPVFLNPKSFRFP